MVNGRVKGSNAERELARLLTVWGKEIGEELNLERNLEQVRGGGFDLNGIPRLAIEVKRVEVPAVAAWWRQTVRQAGTDKVPFLAWRRNRTPWQFRVRSPVTFMCSEGNPAGGLMMDLDLDAEQGKLWFQAFLWYQKKNVQV